MSGAAGGLGTASGHDLVIRAGRVICPGSGRDGPGAVAVEGGRIAAVASDFAGAADKELSFPDGVLLPGLIDLHAHPAKRSSVFGVDPDRWMLPTGVTTVLSQGDAGADNVGNFIEQTIGQSRTRVCLAINLSRIGESTSAGCFERLEDADAKACVPAVEQFREHVWGVAVNVSHFACGSTDPRVVLRRGLQVAEEARLPILFGMRRPGDWPLEEQLALLRSGDVVTYCFRREPHCIVEDGRVLPAVWDARRRGVQFDVGHGTASFDFAVAESAIGDGFLPDTISTDLQRRHLDEARLLDLPLVLSKLESAGMAEPDVLAAVTSAPAKVLRLGTEIGALTAGACADLVVLRRSAEPIELTDTRGGCRSARPWEAILTVRGGQLVSKRDTRRP